MKIGPHFARVLAFAGVAAAALVLGQTQLSAQNQPQPTPESTVSAPARSTNTSARPSSVHDESIIGDQDCSACHTPEGWSLAAGGSTGGGFDHARTGFPLIGSHRRTSCVGCHQPGRKIGRDCSGCHLDEHKGRFGIQCDQCHDSRMWRNTRAIERHRLTRLPLSGVHAMLDCTSCHIRTAERAWSAVPADCFACHERDYRRRNIHPIHEGDPNTGQAPFTRDCTVCHRPTSWRPAYITPGLFGLRQQRQAPADHDARFPISFGKHRGAPCQSCHIMEKQPRVVACTGCHEHNLSQLRLRHSGMVIAGDARSCLNCHPGGVAR